MLKLIACISLFYMLYHFRSILLPGKLDSHALNIKDSATPKVLPGQDSSRIKVVIKVSGLFNGVDSVVVK